MQLHTEINLYTEIKYQDNKSANYCHLFLWHRLTSKAQKMNENKHLLYNFGVVSFNFMHFGFYAQVNNRQVNEPTKTNAWSKTSAAIAPQQSY